MFVHFKGLKDVDKCIKYSKILAKGVNETLYPERHPMELEYEKVFFPFLLITKKRYTALKFEKSSSIKDAELVSAGVETKRRDNSALCGETMQQFLDDLFIKGDKKLAYENIKQVVAKLLSNDIDYAKMRIGKKITKRFEKYKDPIPAQIRIAKELVEKLGADAAPKVGEYVYYMSCWVPQKTKRVGDTFFYFPEAEKNKMAVNHSFYLEKQLAKPLGRMLVHIYTQDEIQQLFDPANYNCTTQIQAQKGNIIGYFQTPSYSRSIKRNIGEKKEKKRTCKTQPLTMFFKKKKESE